MKRNGNLARVLAISMAALLVSLCGPATGCVEQPTPSPTPPPTLLTETIKIGGAVNLTGQYAAAGNELRFGYEQAVEDINAQGGIYVAEKGGYMKLQLTVRDDESDPNKVVSWMEAFASEGVAAYIGTYSSENNARAAAVAEEKQIPLVAGFPSLTPHRQGYRYLFSPSVKTDTGVEAIFDLLDTLPADKRPSRIAVWADETDWGGELRSIVPEAATAHGYQVVVNEEYAEMTLDYSSLILETKEAGAEVVIAGSTPVVLYSMIRQMKEIDYSPGAVVFWPGAANTLWSGSIGGGFTDYTLFLGNWNWNFEYPGNAGPVGVYRATEGKLPSITVGNGYAIVQIIADAITRAGSLDPAKIRDALAATSNLMTVQGMIKEFQPDGVGVCPLAILQWQNQITQVVFHELYKSAELLYPMPPWEQR